MRKPIAYALGTVAALLSVAGCERDPRPSTFTSAAIPGAGGRGAEDAANGAGPAAQPRAVEEADIIKTDGAGHLYVVNAYRGLLILDVTNPDAPQLLGRAPILGQPVDMYLAGGLAYVIVSDYYSWWWDPQSGLNDFHGSQIEVIDVGVPTAPRVLTSFQLEGYVSDTRRVGDVIYAVSNLYSWITNPYAGGGGTDLTYVVSIDVSNPASVRLVDRLDFPGSANQIHATPDALYVAQPRWSQGAGPSIGTTLVQYLDISDPHGQMQLGGTVEVPGYLDSKFQLDDDQGVLRILTHDGGWGTTGSQRLSTFFVNNGTFAAAGALDLPQSGGLFAVRFDGPRAYFATFVSRDPLEIVDLSDPTKPALMASLEIPGTLYQIVPKVDRLVTLGSSDGTWQGVAVSLFDVSDPTRPAMMSQAPVGDPGGYAWTQAFWDDKALSVIDALGLITVPFQAWSPNNNTPTQGVALVDYGRGDVKARGYIAQPGAIQRAFEVTGSAGSRLGTLSEMSLQTADITDRDHPQVTGRLELVRNIVEFARVGAGAVQLLASTDYWYDAQPMRVRTVNLAHADDGTFLAELSLSEPSGRMFQNGSTIYVLGETWQNGPELRVHVIDASDLAHPTERAALDVPLGPNDWYYVGYGYWGGWGDGDTSAALVDGTLLALLGQHGEQQGDTWTYTQRVQVIDLGNPDAPIAEPPVDLGAQWGWGLLPSGRTLYLTHADYIAPQNPQDPPLVRDYMDRVDLSDPAHPSVLPSVNIPGLLVAVAPGGSRIFTVDYQWSATNPTNTFDTLTVQNDQAFLDQAMPVNGQIGRVRLDGDYAYLTTQDWYWTSQAGQTPTYTTALRAIDVTGAASGNMVERSTATLAGIYSLRDVQAGHAFLGTSGFWWWGWGVADGGVAGAGAVPAGGNFAPCIEGGCWGGPGDSLAVFDLANPAAPAFAGATRVNGWIRDIVVDGATAWLPSGYYGVQSLSLAPPVAP